MARGLPPVVAVIACASFALAAPPHFSLQDGTLTITTDRWEVQWRDGGMAALRTRLPRPASLTLHDGPMAPEALPAGLCTLAGHEQEARDQHHPWNVRTLDPQVPIAFPAQHPPTAHTKLTVAQVPGGVELTYRGLAGESDAVLVQRLTVDAGTGDLVVAQRARSPNPGVIGITLAIPNLRGDIELAVPYFGGQRWGTRFCAGRLIGIAYPQFWSAGLVIGELPAGGSFMVWADDPNFRPKHLYLRHEGAAQGLAFEAMAEAPYEDRTSARTFAWRFNTWPGGWMEPATRFREWLVRAHQMVPRAERSSAWVDEIALVWPAGINAEAMARMAHVFPAERTLMMQWGWLDGFNRRVPEYVSRFEDFADQISAAHALGYRVGVYTSCGLIDVEAWPDMVEQMGLDYKYDAPWRPRRTPAEAPDAWLWYIHPGSARWRDFYAGKMREIVDRYGIDYLYQDVSGCGVGSSGLVEGLNYHEAMVACETEIRERVPEAAIGGEFWTEVNACREDFAVGSYLNWDCGAEWEGGLRHRDMIGAAGQAHPLMGFLFDDYCIRWPHSVPIRDTRKFHHEENINEVTGAVAVWATDTDDLTGEARLTLEKARLWAEGFRPWFPREWEPHVVGYLRNPEGRVIKYLRPDEASLCYEERPEGDRLVYARITGRSEVTLGQPVQIDGWVAYGAQGPIGLSPERYYCAFPGEAAQMPLVVTALPQGAGIADTRVGESYALVAINGKSAGEIRWRTLRPPAIVVTGAGPRDPGATAATEALPTHLLVGFTEPSAPVLGEVLPLEAWDHRIMADGLVVKPARPISAGRYELEGEAHSGPHVMPPAGGPGSEYCIDGFLRLPDDPDLALRFWAGQTGRIGDGVHFVVRVNGRELFRHFRETGPGWQELTVPLRQFAGRTVLLSLGLDAGKAGHNTSCDNSIWGDATLVAQE